MPIGTVVPVVSVGLHACAVVAGGLEVGMVKSEEIAPHAYDVREVHDAVVVPQVGIDSPDEA